MTSMNMPICAHPSTHRRSCHIGGPKGLLNVWVAIQVALPMARPGGGWVVVVLVVVVVVVMVVVVVVVVGGWVGRWVQFVQFATG